MSATRDYVTTVKLQNVQSTFTFNNTDIGTAAANRLVGLVVLGTTSSPATAFTSVKLDGNSATQLGSTILSTGLNPVYASIWIIAFPTGTDADIEVIFTVTVYDCVVQVYDIKGADATLIDSATTNAPGGTTADLSLDVPSGGVAFGGASAYVGTDADGVSWTGLAEDFEEHNFGDSNQYSCASYEAASEQAPLNVDVTFDFTTGSLAAIVVSLAATAAPATGRSSGQVFG